VHAAEALVMARYYMFTQVYFNVTGKALELHLSAWLAGEGLRWPAGAADFVAIDDVTVLGRMRQSRSPHARAVVEREHYPLAFETREHLTREDKARFEALLPELYDRFGAGNLLVSNSAKDSHRLGESRVLVRRYDGALEPLEEASQFIRHLTRIDRYRVYTPQAHCEAVREALRSTFG
jgi:HD superfamily phosphohydrolase